LQLGLCIENGRCSFEFRHRSAEICCIPGVRDPDKTGSVSGPKSQPNHFFSDEIVESLPMKGVGRRNKQFHLLEFERMSCLRVKFNGIRIYVEANRIYDALLNQERVFLEVKNALLVGDHYITMYNTSVASI